jgi:Protein of unknown function DUF72
MANIYIGTAGYQYAHWRKIFYPPGLPQHDELKHYTSLFPSVEINSTFYGVPRTETLTKWRSTVHAQVHPILTLCFNNILYIDTSVIRTNIYTVRSCSSSVFVY